MDAIIDTNDNNKQFIVLVLADPDIGFPLGSTSTNEASFPNVIYVGSLHLPGNGWPINNNITIQ